MKKLAFIAVAALLALCSCKEESINLTEQLPEMKGEWLWTHTVVGGVVGIIHANDDKPLIIDFKGNNTISVIYNDETIVRNASYTCEEVDSPYGKYLIKLPKEVRSRVAEKMGVSESRIVVDGYILLDNDEDLSEPCWTLFITDVEGHDVGVEGGSDFHYCSGFIPNRIVLF